VRVDPRDGRVQRTLGLEHAQGEITGLAWDGQNLWLGDGGEAEGRALKLNPRSGVVLHKTTVPAGVSGLAWAGDRLWVAEYEARVLARVDPESGQVDLKVAVKGHPGDLAWDGERLWYVDAEWKLLSRILEPLP
jgi:streptogramin lyase